MAETAIFTMIKGKIRICNGKIFRRMNFLTMRKAILRVFMVKLCQGRREETCEPFFVALMDVFHEPVFACVHIFVIPEGARFQRSRNHLLEKTGREATPERPSRSWRKFDGALRYAKIARRQTPAPIESPQGNKKGAIAYSDAPCFYNLINLRTASCTEWCRLRCT